MSVLNRSGEDQAECPLCMELLEVDDLHFYPCTCGYQICRFCWNRIREGENGLCPACRKSYPENPADFTPLSQEQVAAIKTEKKAREQRRRNKTLESRRALANVRVVQNNLVFVVGLPVRLADPEILKRQEYFGKYGKIHKVVINQSTTYAGSQGPSASAYVTYVSPSDALRAIQGVNNVTLDGRVLKGSLGTTKYCANFMKNQPCPKTDCMYLHELGDQKASFTKEEMHQGLHQIYERKLHNQLQAQTQREQAALAADKALANGSGNSSTNGEKNSSKEGNQSNFIPTTIVTSSHISIVNSNSKSKKEASSSGSAGSSSSASSKEAWPSLGSSPPSSESSGSKQASPKPSLPGDEPTVTSQVNGTSEGNSPTQLQLKNRENHTEPSKPKVSKQEYCSTNSHTKKSKSTDHQKSSKKKSSNSINENSDEDKSDQQTGDTSDAFDSHRHSYLSNELDELESDRHSLLENHDLLDSSDHSLLEDDSSHNLLNDANSEALLMQRHREMFAGLVDNHLMPQHVRSNPLANGFGLLDNREVGYLGSDRQMNQMLEQKELMMRERGRSEMLMRRNEQARQMGLLHEHKHYAPGGLDAASDMIGASYHHSPNTLPPFGVRMDGTMPAPGFALPRAPPPHLSNGYAEPLQEVRYGENIDNFFTDFHKNQQLKFLMAKGEVAPPRLPAEVQSHAYIESQHLARKYGNNVPDGYMHYQHNMSSADLIEMEHKQRQAELAAQQAAGDADDDLDFDPFMETQKALAEMMESEMLQNSVNSGDNLERLRRARQPPPGFSHMNAFGIGVPRPQPAPQDWTQMDPAIMSTSVNFPHKAILQQQQNMMSQQQQELFARFNHMSVAHAPNGLNKLLNGQIPGPQTAYLPQHKLPWALPPYEKPYASIPLPPGFAPTAKPPQHPAECIDAK